MSEHRGRLVSVSVGDVDVTSAFRGPPALQPIVSRIDEIESGERIPCTIRRVYKTRKMYRRHIPAKIVGVLQERIRQCAHCRGGPRQFPGALSFNSWRCDACTQGYPRNPLTVLVESESVHGSSERPRLSRWILMGEGRSKAWDGWWSEWGQPGRYGDNLVSKSFYGYVLDVGEAVRDPGPEFHRAKRMHGGIGPARRWRVENPTHVAFTHRQAALLRCDAGMHDWLDVSVHNAANDVREICRHCAQSRVTYTVSF